EKDGCGPSLCDSVNVLNVLGHVVQMSPCTLYGVPRPHTLNTLVQTLCGLFSLFGLLLQFRYVCIKCCRYFVIHSSPSSICSILSYPSSLQGPLGCYPNTLGFRPV